MSQVVYSNFTILVSTKIKLWFLGSLEHFLSDALDTLSKVALFFEKIHKVFKGQWCSNPLKSYKKSSCIIMYKYKLLHVILGKGGEVPGEICEILLMVATFIWNIFPHVQRGAGELEWHPPRPGKKCSFPCKPGSLPPCIFPSNRTYFPYVFLYFFPLDHKISRQWTSHLAYFSRPAPTPSSKSPHKHVLIHKFTTISANNSGWKNARSLQSLSNKA